MICGDRRITKLGGGISVELVRRVNDFQIRLHCKNRLVAWCELHIAFDLDDTTQIYNMFTLFQDRRKGYASIVMREALIASLDIGCPCMELWSTSEGVPLYRSLGFRMLDSFRPEAQHMCFNWNDCV